MNYREDWRRQGYLVLPKALDKTRIAELQELSEAAFAQWQQESTEENQPGGYAYGPTAWALLHLNHPRYHRQHPERLPILLDAIAQPKVLGILREIFQAEPTFMQSNLYINPSGEDRIGNWHRDCQFYGPESDAYEERTIAAEADPPRELHMHIPLVPTQVSEVVPGSHTRPDTPEENRIRRHDAFSDDMPGALKLKLEPGDLAFFHVNALHRGQYQKDILRRTIAVTFGSSNFLRPTTAELMKNWRGYSASYQPWIGGEGYLDGVAPETRDFFQNFIALYRDSWKPEYLDGLHPALQSYFK